MSTRDDLRAREDRAKEALRRELQRLSERVGAQGAIFSEVRLAGARMCWARPLSWGAWGGAWLEDGKGVDEELVDEIRRPNDESFRRFRTADDAEGGGGDVARTLIFNEDRLVGWVGFMKSRGTFTPSELDGLSQEIETLGDVARSFGRASDAVMAACAGLSLVFASKESVAYRTELQGGCFTTDDLVRFGELCFDAREQPAMIKGWLLRVQEVEGDAGAGRLVHVEIAPRAERSPDFALTEMQRRVAEYARSGATVSEIARTMGRSPHTIKTHLKSVYERLGVASRLELAARLGGGELV
ncbi:helix-turn-helix transcriptional regulator [Lujinxingia vulgaris]|uniref:Helix-turn-helix transcriptional regulator n=1 Tax=Lujinxingia vulgaris TaxID=2600176 RepID=A0A5C6X5Z6_9DELT|nr:helix-turn-helix transcriptional regulator [Lujinxingia vulgaris]TXD37220.1 helix-turn-helix transcriptional regulator [Lujinxingia vulgaris]